MGVNGISGSKDTLCVCDGRILVRPREPSAALSLIQLDHMSADALESAQAVQAVHRGSGVRRLVSQRRRERHHF